MLIDGWRRAAFPAKVAQQLIDGSKQIDYRSLRPNPETLDEHPPSFELPRARITPVTAGSVETWLADDLTWKRRDAYIETIPKESIASATQASQIGNGPQQPFTWNQGPSLAHGIELALHQGDLEEPFFSWIKTFEKSLADYEKEWREAAERSERELRNRWSNASDISTEDEADGHA